MLGNIFRMLTSQSTRDAIDAFTTDDSKLVAEYFVNLSRFQDPAEIAAIKKEIDLYGVWSEDEEWRISTYRKCQIKRVDFDEHRVFQVTVDCDHRMECCCPTIERAVEFLRIYRRLISDAFYQRGWPSWASKRKREP